MKSYYRFIPLICLILLITVLSYFPCQTRAIGIANVVVTSVYWGSNPQMPMTPHPGEVNVQLSIVLTNVGDDIARGVGATLLIGPPLKYTYYIDGAEYSETSVTKTAGDMEAGFSYTLFYTLSIESNAIEGNYRYDLEISYRSARELQQINKTITIDIPIWWGDLRVQSVETYPGKIYRSTNEIEVWVTLANSGTGIVSNLPLLLDVKHPFKVSSSGSDRYLLGNLEPGMTETIKFVLDIEDDAIFGRYTLILKEERDKESVPIGDIPLYINEKATFKILDITPESVNVGDTGIVIKVEVKNTALVKAESVRVQLRVGNFFTGTLTDFLGTMSSGDEKIAFFTIDIDSKAQSRQYIFDLRIDWTQEENSLDDTLRIDLNVQAPEAPVVPFVLIIIVVAIAGYFLLKRRKKHRSNTK